MKSQFWILAAILAAYSLPTWAPAQPTAPEPMTDSAVLAWGRISDAMMSASGNWFVYTIVSGPLRADMSPGRRMDTTVVIRNAHSDDERRFHAGDPRQGAGYLRMSPSGKWIAYSCAPCESGSPTGVVLVELSSGKSLSFPAARRFVFAGRSDEYLVLESCAACSPGAAVELVVRDLQTGNLETLGDVREYSLDPSAARIAWVRKGALHVAEIGGPSRVLATDGAESYTSLSWSPHGNALALRRADSLVIFTRIGSTPSRKQEFSTRSWKGFPPGMEIVAPLQWRADERGVFFHISAGARVAPIQPAQATTPNLALWHWQDERLPAQKTFDDRRVPPDLCFVSLSDGQFVHLSDSRLHVDPHPRARLLLGFDTSAYGWQNPGMSMRAYQVRDYYLVDLQTGQRRPLVKGLYVATWPLLSAPPQLSPAGDLVLYQNNSGDYIAHHIARQTDVNLTAALPVKFFYPENNPANRYHPRARAAKSDVLQGWSSDGRYVLLSDYNDIWALPLNGGKALNLTRNGRKNQWDYSFSSLSVPDSGLQEWQDSTIDLNRKLYFDVYDSARGVYGLATATRAHAEPEVCLWGSAYPTYLKASRADVIAYAPQTTVQFPDYYLLGADFKPGKRLTDVNPQQRQLQWWPEAKYLTYTTAHGDVLHASLHLPINYVSGNRYPTILEIYEEGQAVTTYVRPDDSYIARWLRAGYAVLLPDIRPRLREAGAAALESIDAAIAAAVAQGGVDSARLGLTGHSYGGYETYYVVSHSQVFKAAVPESGVVDLISWYGGIYSESGGHPRSLVVEHSQGFIDKPWWIDQSAYLRNSALFNASAISTPLLIVHGDKDDAVPFTQAAELFNTLRRMGDKPVVLLQYMGEGHVFSPETQRDIDRRMEQFFDHFLKGWPAPAWWSDAVSYSEGHAPAVSAAMPVN